MMSPRLFVGRNRRRKEKEKWEVRMEDVKLRYVPRRDERRDRRRKALSV